MAESWERDHLGRSSKRAGRPRSQQRLIGTRPNENCYKVPKALNFKRRKAMSINVTDTAVCNFVEALSHLTDDRDNRGNRHALAFVVAAVV